MYRSEQCLSCSSYVTSAKLTANNTQHNTQCHHSQIGTLKHIPTSGIQDSLSCIHIALNTIAKSFHLDSDCSGYECWASKLPAAHALVHQIAPGYDCPETLQSSHCTMSVHKLCLFTGHDRLQLQHMKLCRKVTQRKPRCVFTGVHEDRLRFHHMPIRHHSRDFSKRCICILGIKTFHIKHHRSTTACPVHSYTQVH